MLLRPAIVQSVELSGGSGQSCPTIRVLDNRAEIEWGR